jgi:hypothetical protein
LPAKNYEASRAKVRPHFAANLTPRFPHNQPKIRLRNSQPVPAQAGSADPALSRISSTSAPRLPSTPIEGPRGTASSATSCRASTIQPPRSFGHSSLRNSYLFRISNFVLRTSVFRSSAESRVIFFQNPAKNHQNRPLSSKILQNLAFFSKKLQKITKNPSLLNPPNSSTCKHLHHL